MGTEPVCPAALCSLSDHGIHAPLGYLFGVSAGADSGNRNDASVFEPLHDGFLRGGGEAGHRHAHRDDRVYTLLDVGRIGAQVHAERIAGALSDFLNGSDHLLEGKSGGSQNPQPASVAHPDHQRRISHPPHARLHNRIANPEKLGRTRREGRGRRIHEMV